MTHRRGTLLLLTSDHGNYALFSNAERSNYLEDGLPTGTVVLVLGPPVLGTLDGILTDHFLVPVMTCRGPGFMHEMDLDPTWTRRISL